ncbi:hypothetical protein Scep_010347 [Stephania cephalantha]|uniref:NB-ARC domain-containing protein n=1 Tax=Stephania cephalantha TaxID=152367 RepID=A0AAP0PH56_9MAGN
MDAQDILDDVRYHELRRRCRRNRHGEVSFSYSFSSLGLQVRISHRLNDLNSKLDEIANAKSTFGGLKFYVVESERVGLNPNPNPNPNPSRETVPFVIVSEVFGRESDKSTVMEMLFGGTDDDDDDVLPVISIVGPMGIGKTTLAQLVYNDKYVRDHFELRFWISVSDGFVVKRLLAQILQQILCKNCELTSMNEIGIWVHRELVGKRFLIVLDGVSAGDLDLEEKWDDFTLPLRCCGSLGSRIISTTRSQTVASNVGSTYTYPLSALSDEDCLLTFERAAFGKGGLEGTNILRDIGTKIVKKCEGVPHLARRMGGFMRFEREEQYWLRILDCDIRDVIDEQYDGTAVFGRSSLNNLPPQLNSCLIYCSIFPKGYQVKKDTLIQLWMAQGFLEASDENKSMEDIGNEYFNLLCSRSFHDVKRNEFGDVISCKMNSNVHDHARSVAKSKCQIVEVNDHMLDQDLSECRHLSLLSNGDRLTLPVSPFQLEKLRTFCLLKATDLGDRLLVAPRASFASKLLRVLDLTGSSVGRFYFSITNLKHLRYLDLSQTDIEVLPKCISQLYNLQTLKLEKCKFLRKLPKDLANLINLRHLHIDSSGKWEEMPENVGQLRYLQTLPVFKLSNGAPHRSFGELKCLKSLQGRLEILHLENARGNMSTAIDCLKDIKNVHNLSLQWKDEIRDGSIEVHEEEEHDNIAPLLEMLQPHSNLKILQILNFPGVAFPRWVTSGSHLSSLVEMNLQGCYKLKHIQSFGELPHLKVLNIREMSNVKCIGGLETECNTSVADIADEQEARATTEVRATAFYPHLKRLILVEMPNLEEWLEGSGLKFKCLEQLTLQRCPKLRKMPYLFPSLKELDIEEVGGMGVKSIDDWPRLQKSLSEHSCSLLEFS